MDTNNVDSNAKYQKLATEYSKVRAQVSVLKKAVIEEQNKAAEYKEALKEKDQSIRKFEQEIDSLVFRNQQLSKRVNVLQDELEASVKTKRNRQKHNEVIPSVNISNIVIGEELQSKIEENARLHKLVFESDQEHHQAVAELKNRLESVQQEAARYQQILQNIQDQNKLVVEKLQNDKAQLEVRLQNQEKALKESKSKAEECDEELKHVKTNLQTRLDNAEAVLLEHLPFNDTRISELNVLNIPAYDRKHHLVLNEFITKVQSLIRDFVTSLSNFHTYTEQRVKAISDDFADDRPLKQVNKIFAQYLHENATYLRPLEQTFSQFQKLMQTESPFFLLESLCGLQQFTEKFTSYVAYLNKLLPYHLLSIEDECSLLSCTPTLEAKNLQIHSSISQMTSAFNRVGTYISALAAPDNSMTAFSHSSQIRLINLLANSLHNLHVIIKETSTQYTAKISLEHQLPTFTQKLKTTDECVLSSMISLVTCTNKISVLVKDNMNVLTLRPDSCRREHKRKHLFPTSIKTIPMISRFQHRAANYISALDEESPKSVPYEEALKNREILLSSTESRESLARQLATSQEKIAKSEQAKEHWMLEFQLLQIKHEKEIKKLQRLEEQLRSAGDALSVVSSSSSTDDVTPPTMVGDFPSTSSITSTLLGKLDITGTFYQPDSGKSELQIYFMHHIKDLVSQMQTADSKAVIFHSELCILHKRLQLSEKQRTSVVDQLTDSQKSTENLKEELSTTTKNYENQLSMMSEHLANMNDKLSAQKDEIDELKYQLNKSGFKKGGKNK